MRNWRKSCVRERDVTRSSELPDAAPARLAIARCWCEERKENERKENENENEKRR